MKEGVQFFKLDRETNALIPDPKIRFYASSHIDVVANVCAEIKHRRYEGKGDNCVAFRFVRVTFTGKIKPIVENIYLLDQWGR